MSDCVIDSSALLSIVLSSIVLMLVRVSLRLCGYWSFLATLLLLGLGASVGFMLLIVPGVLFALAFAFAPLFKAEGERDLIEAA